MHSYFESTYISSSKTDDSSNYFKTIPFFNPSSVYNYFTFITKIFYKLNKNLLHFINMNLIYFFPLQQNYLL